MYRSDVKMEVSLAHLVYGVAYLCLVCLLVANAIRVTRQQLSLCVKIEIMARVLG